MRGIQVICYHALKRCEKKLCEVMEKCNGDTNKNERGGDINLRVKG